MVGLLWNPELHSEGTDGGGGGMMEQQRGCNRVSDPFPSPCMTSLSQAAGGGVVEPQQGSAMPPPLPLASATGLMPFEASVGASATPSLRDLLLEKWPPASLCDSL